MSDQLDDGWHVRRVPLPSGAEIETVSHEEQAALEDDLHRCGSCGSELVYPLEWEPAGSTHWRVTLRCPNCEWSGTGVFDQIAVERFDDRLDEGTAALIDVLKWLTWSNREEEIDRFVRALDADAILPADFGAPDIA